MMITPLNFVIRDAIATDIEDCLALDHQYQTKTVWQMTILPDGEAWQVQFREERLPREIDVLYPSDNMRLRLALPREICYLVAVSKTEPETLLAYLTLRPDPVHKIALIQDIVVGREYRNKGIGTRLLGIARHWASEHGAQQLMLETQTINYPSIRFCQKNGLSFCGFNDQYYRNLDIAVFFGQTLR
ncbi:MAG: GNAT family N-acetyltransferase [Anaerolineae bacterium]|nr:GNAT family N-acetyltransferase [Anaerolineae bacterium]